MLQLLFDALADAEKTFTLLDWVRSVLLFCAVVWVGVFWKGPLTFLSGYLEWVHENHGRGVELGMSLLLAVLAVPAAYVIAVPGEYPILDRTMPFILFGWIVVVAWDMWKFQMHRRRGRA